MIYGLIYGNLVESGSQSPHLHDKYNMIVGC